MKYLPIVIVFILATACKKSNLEIALEFAGDNRTELEKVLSHYGRNAEDSLKLKAAQYLIENMPGHVYFDDSNTNGYFAKIDSLYPDEPFYIKHTLYDLPSFVLSGGNNMKQDIHYIKADYLIRHIDYSFDLWLSSPWAVDVPFDTFRDHILPYRVGYEPLDRLMAFDDKPDAELMASMARGNNMPLIAYYLPYLTQLYLSDSVGIHRLNTYQYDIPGPVSDKQYMFECTSLANAFKWLANYAGMPVAIDYVPYWNKTEDGHHWNSIIDSHFKSVNYHHMYYYAGKVYRKTYYRNEVPQYNGQDYIPAIFRNPFKKDVTDLYAYTKDINISIQNIKGKKPDDVYLCVFNRLDWRPVAWGKKKRGKAKFDNVAVGGLYLPIYYDDRDMRNFNYPFCLSASGDVQLLKPAEEKDTLRLNRKYNIKHNDVLMARSMLGFEVVGMNDPSGEGDLLYTLTDSDIYNAPHYDIELPHKKYRYIKLVNRSTSYIIPEIAEIAFLNAQKELYDIKDVIVDASNNDTRPVSNLYDNKKLSSLRVGANIIFDFGKEIEMSKIELLTRTDDNYIVPGEEYELLYHDDQGWVSMGHQVAEHHHIEFSGVPKNALYWLRNHTKGVEERPFTYENGKVVFW